MTSEIRIYVACLAAYNNGILHGAWIDADQEPNEIRTQISSMLKASPIPQAEEYAIHDYEGFEGIQLCEYTGIEEVAAFVEFLTEHGALGGKLIEHFGDLKTAREAIDENYAGTFRSVTDFVQELTEETTEIPKALRHYIDWDAMARDFEINDIIALETDIEEVHIFWQI
ncbi:MAG: antirestriction protein ArdA [Pseudomonadota bacterium]